MIGTINIRGGLTSPTWRFADQLNRGSEETEVLIPQTALFIRALIKTTLTSAV